MNLGPGRRSAGAVFLGVLLLGACSPATPGPSATGASTPGPTTTAGPSGGTSDPSAVTLTYDIGPRPGPVQPFRGEMSQHVHIAFGQASMYFALRNTGEDPVTFINTLYDYEPLQLYTPVVRLEWAEGGSAVYTRAGRFFPSPSIVPAGETAAYLMGGQAVSGTGTPADLVAHIKYCPTRGMDDRPGVPLAVTDLSWTVGDGGQVTIQGNLVDADDTHRNRSPMVGVAFFDAAGEFEGAVVAAALGDPLAPGETKPFTLSGGGVSTEQIDHATAWAVVP